MSPHTYLRLRQICLVTADRARAELLLGRVLGLNVAFRDERIGRYGLENALLPLGTSFLEIVAPIEPGTAAGRFLDRHQGRHGYMAIFDCSNLDAVRQRVERLGIRILHSRKWPRYENLQLHPRDTGAVLVEIHHNEGGDALDGYYEPAGEHWHAQVRDDVSVALLGAELTSREVEPLARRWSALLDKPLALLPDGGYRIALEAGKLDFLPGTDDDHLHALHVTVRDVDAVLSEAVRLGCEVDGTSVDLCGVWFRLLPA